MLFTDFSGKMQQVCKFAARMILFQTIITLKCATQLKPISILHALSFLVLTNNSGVLKWWSYGCMGANCVRLVCSSI